VGKSPNRPVRNIFCIAISYANRPLFVPEKSKTSAKSNSPDWPLTKSGSPPTPPGLMRYELTRNLQFGDQLYVDSWGMP
jgi:hypothetical protein